MARSIRRASGFLAIAVAVLAFVGIWSLLSRDRGALVVYCAHDAVFSEQVLRGFEQATGIPINIVFDTEATKSLGLVEQLIREKNAPRCDVFWNNELLGTLDLQEKGVTLPYKGTGYARIPDQFKDPDGHWVGFAARFRVWIINSKGWKEGESAQEFIARRLQGDLSRVAIAKPLYGTTLTHYTVLWNQWGAEKLNAWHKDWRARGVIEAAGNAKVKDLVAQGVCDLGLTDTDDFFEARDAEKPVIMVPFRLDGGATICIPNTVCIIRGTRRLGQAQKLVDYLLSEETERRLSDTRAIQMPLGPLVSRCSVNNDIVFLYPWMEKTCPLASLGRARAECLAWLKSEYLR